VGGYLACLAALVYYNLWYVYAGVAAHDAPTTDRMSFFRKLIQPSPFLGSRLRGRTYGRVDEGA
jgi:hypothetical protein